MIKTASSTAPDLARAALASRLRAVAGVILPGALTTAHPDLATDAAATLESMVAALRSRPSVEEVWLVLTAIAAAFPTRDEVDQARRALEFGDSGESAMFLLDSCLDRARTVGSPFSTIDLVVGGVVVEVDQSARFDLHTGIQQVTRNLLPFWDADHSLVPAAWTESLGCLRRLNRTETSRVLSWERQQSQQREQDGTDSDAVSDDHDLAPTLVVPWRSVVVLVDVPEEAASIRVAAIGAASSNRVVAIAYDAIPIASADTIPIGGSGRFGIYLSAVKFASRVAGISAAAAAEIEGFVTTLPTQGLTGPAVVEVSLPAGGSGARRTTEPTGFAGDSGCPQILVVGSHEPRKNHLAVLHAAEMLWQHGIEFSVRFIGGMGWGDEFPNRVAALQAKSRPVEVQRAVDDETLQRAFADARFTMFPSLHEGYGLPVVESFAHRKPVITSDFGSTAEIAAAGGALLVDPRDDAALVSAMRKLLTDDAELARLTEQISRRNDRTWKDYADDLWAALVAPELTALSKDLL